MEKSSRPKINYSKCTPFVHNSGRYGYVDPDGEKRTYNYETGILCDPNKRDEEEPEEELEQEFVPHVKHFKRPQFKN